MPSRQGTVSDSRLDNSFISDSSDDEQVSELRDWAATDFWLGKKYFELNLLRCIIKDHPCCDPATLESHLHEKSQRYPYEQNLKFLQDQLHRNLWRDTDAEYKDLIVTVGRIQRLGTTHDKIQLKKSLNHFGGNPAGGMPSDTETSRSPVPQPTSFPALNSATPPKPNERPKKAAATPAAGKAAEQAASPRHVTTLELYGDSIGEAPNYTYRRCPALAEATMTFRGRTLESSGRTVKEAKQQVAKAACTEFGLSVPSK